MRGFGIFFAETVSLAFFCKHVQYHRLRSEHLFNFFELCYHSRKVVAVEYAFVGKPELFKYARPAVLMVLFLLVCAKRFEVFVHTAHRGRDRHTVVVYDYENVGTQRPQAVESLVNKPVVERTVAYHGNHVVIFARKVARFGKTERRRNRSACVPRVVTVVHTLFPLAKA